MFYRGTDTDAGRLLTHWATWCVWQPDVDPTAAREALQRYAGKKKILDIQLEDEEEKEETETDWQREKKRERLREKEREREIDSERESKS